MIDAGEFTPTSELGPTRSPTGATVLPRDTTTEEQYGEALEFLTAAATEHQEREARARIVWSRGEPTIMEATFTVEHLSGKRVWLPESVNEVTLDGGYVHYDEAVRLRVLNDEVANLHDRGML